MGWSKHLTACNSCLRAPGCTVGPLSRNISLNLRCYSYQILRSCSNNSAIPSNYLLVMASIAPDIQKGPHPDYHQLVNPPPQHLEGLADWIYTCRFLYLTLKTVIFLSRSCQSSMIYWNSIHIGVESIVGTKSYLLALRLRNLTPLTSNNCFGEGFRTELKGG